MNTASRALLSLINPPMPTLISASRCHHGESPCWHPQLQLLFWVDLSQGQLHRYCPETGQFDCQRLPGLSAVTSYDAESLLLTQADGLYRYFPLSGNRQLLRSLPLVGRSRRVNEIKCDPLGRCFIGSMAHSEQPGYGRLLQINPLGCQLLLDGLTIANGMAWSLKGERFYFIDSPTRRIMEFDYQLDKGFLQCGNLLLDLASEDGYPDGMAIDAEGFLWVAMWSGYQILKIDPLRKKVVARIPVPVKQVTSICFGGSKLDTLYITTAQKDLSPAELAEEPWAGALLAMDVGTCGIKTVTARSLCVM